MRTARWLAAPALALMLAVPARAHAQTPLTPDTWFRFSWSGLGMISTSFQAMTSTLRVVDCCIVGDMFEIFVNGTSVGTTSSVLASDGTSTGATTGDLAWADSRLSKGVFFVNPGEVITLSVTQRTDAATSGAGFIQSASTASTAPEPGTVVLLLSGLVGLAFVGFRRRDASVQAAA